MQERGDAGALGGRPDARDAPRQWPGKPLITVGRTFEIPSTMNWTEVAARMRPIAARWRTFIPVRPSRRLDVDRGAENRKRRAQ